MRPLLLDMLRRRNLFFLCASIYFVAAANTSSFTGSSVGMGLGVGAMLGIAFESRELHYLPISRKEIWRARWILALSPVILAALFRVLTFAIGTVIAQALSHRTRTDLSWVPPSVAFQLVFLGSLLAASLPVSYITGKFASPARRVLAKAALVLTAVTLGVKFEQKLPTHWQDLTGGTGLILAIGLCLSVIGFFHSPKIVPREFFAKRLEPSSRAIKPNLKSRSLWAGFTGLNLLVWTQFLAFLITGVVCGIGSQVPLIVLGWNPADRASLIERGRTLFVSPDPGMAAVYFLMPVVLSAMWTAMAPDSLRVRHLRVLPMTTRTLAAMFTMLPTLTWLTYWICLLAGYWLLAGHLPSTFRLDLLAGTAGLTCLLNSAFMQARVISRGSFFLHLLACGGLIFLYQYLQPLSLAVTILVGGFGLIGVAVSFLLNVRALQQNSSVYVSLIRIHTAYPQRFLAR